MAYRLRKGACVVCGEHVERRWRTNRPLRCLQHSVERAISNARQMADRSGPAYDQWLAGMEKACREGRITPAALAGARASVGKGPKPSGADAYY